MIDERELIKTLVRVMLEQIEYLYSVSDDEITVRMCAKLWRQLERMEGEND